MQQNKISHRDLVIKKKELENSIGMKIDSDLFKNLYLNAKFNPQINTISKNYINYTICSSLSCLAVYVFPLLPLYGFVIPFEPEGSFTSVKKLNPITKQPSPRRKYSIPKNKSAIKRKI